MGTIRVIDFEIGGHRAKMAPQTLDPTGLY